MLLITLASVFYLFASRAVEYVTTEQAIELNILAQELEALQNEVPSFSMLLIEPDPDTDFKLIEVSPDDTVYAAIELSH